VTIGAPGGAGDLISWDGDQLTLPLVNDATTPTLAFGDGNSGIYESADNTLRIASNGLDQVVVTTSGICSYEPSAQRACLLAEVASAINPTSVPVQSDLNTGVGANAADELSLIAGGVEMIRLDEDVTNIDSVFTKVVAADDPDADTCADSADGNPGALTITPTTSYVEITNSDIHGCDIRRPATLK
jgi:hypothetical protein